MKMLYIVTKGKDDATLASVPLHLAANGSLEIGQEVSVILAGDATDLIVGENVGQLEGLGRAAYARASRASCASMRFPSTSERVARSPVGRQGRALGSLVDVGSAARRSEAVRRGRQSGHLLKRGRPGYNRALILCYTERESVIFNRPAHGVSPL
jgi:hypothetical protein